ncbi:hypothetical protein BC477_06460 [Clavibacter michiganensis subsp. michiganensis]|uniref:Uncharacterized protein n=1 Tax=Clavibacter michiganensis subsp. michiganensis TaxID=33013 RepID=A0A251XMC8_CLAMM|nr:hypothetical protein BC477_06460 [Clavibacter michiganensis subsp. michiganensis]OUE04359.1 hypothetical protein CMMCAS07_05390 [Clavibacter michiganensis subsp. michiganensis]
MTCASVMPTVTTMLRVSSVRASSPMRTVAGTGRPADSRFWTARRMVPSAVPEPRTSGYRQTEGAVPEHAAAEPGRATAGLYPRSPAMRIPATVTAVAAAATDDHRIARRAVLSVDRMTAAAMSRSPIPRLNTMAANGARASRAVSTLQQSASTSPER